MQFPQVVVFESDGKLARHLAESASFNRWLMREVRQTDACLNWVRRRGPVVLVLKVGRNLQRELEMLDAVRSSMPDVPVIAVTDLDDPLLESLMYDLGATFVLLPPLRRSQLAELVERVMQSAIARVKQRAFLLELGPRTKTTDEPD